MHTDQIHIIAGHQTVVGLCLQVRGGDGKYGRPYFCHVDEYGNLTKPFVLPQEDPWHYENSLRSFNIPDLSDGPVIFDAKSIGQMVKEIEAETFKINGNKN